MSDSKLQEARAATQKALKEIQALVDNNPSQDSQALISRVMDYCQSLAGRMGYLEDTVMNHRQEMADHMGNGHLPPIKSREQMGRAIKNLGLDNEYETAPKRVVYANTKFGPVAVIGKDVEI